MSLGTATSAIAATAKGDPGSARAPGQYAQLGDVGGTAIARVVTVDGVVTAIHADGTQESLAADSLLYAGDVIESGPGSVAGLVLLDGTTLAIDENASIVLDELIYEPGSDQGQLSISVLDGVFSLTTGDVASGNPSDLVINSPLAVAGVRGTHVGLKVVFQDGVEQWFLVPDANGDVGSFQLLSRLTGAVLEVTEAFQAIALDGDGEFTALALTPEEIQAILAGALGAEPINLTHDDSDPDEYELAAMGEALGAIAPAAGPEADGAVGFIAVTLNLPTSWRDWLNADPDPVQTGILPVDDDNDDDGGSRPTDDSDHDDDVPPDDTPSDGVVRLPDGGAVFNGTSGDDTAFGGGGDDAMFGGGGDDLLRGGGGRDVIDGGTGNDQAFGEAGNDILIGGSGQGDDLLDGGPGRDTVVYGSATLGIVVDLGAGTASGDPVIGVDVLNGIENVVGGAGDDIIRGSEADNRLLGGGGDDLLVGAGGDDVLIGGAGRDTVDYSGATEGVVVDLGAGTGSGGPTIGTDTLVGIENAVGGDGGDQLVGSAAANVLDGGGGDDLLIGGGGNDVLDGGDEGDVAVFSGPRSNYRIVDAFKSGAGVTVTDLVGDEGTDFFRSGGVLRFADGDVVLRDGQFNDAPTIHPAGDLVVELGSVAVEHDLSDVPPFSAFDPDAPNGVDQGALTLARDHGVTMTFVGQSTSDDNIVGTYRIGPNGAITDVRIVFGNASDLVANVSQAELDVAAGDRIGVFVVADGASLNDLPALGLGAFAFVDDDGHPATTATVDPRLVHIDSHLQVTEIQAAGGAIYHTAGGVLNVDGAEHVGSGTEDGGLVLAFEVEPDGADFDDLVVRLDFEPVDVPRFVPIAVAPFLDLEDPEGGPLLGASVDLVKGLAGDRLAIDPGFVAGLGLSVADEGTRLVFSGAASVETYEDVLAHVTLASDLATLGRRILSFIVIDDGSVASDAATIDVDVIDASFRLQVSQGAYTAMVSPEGPLPTAAELAIAA